jgi:phosphate transport system substrate-binding protein
MHLRSSRTATAGAVAVLVALLATLVGCGDSGTPEPLPMPSGEQTESIRSVRGSIKGSGASFPDAFYQEAITGLGQVSDLRVTYEAVGSAAGREAFFRRLADFAGTDSPVADDEDVDRRSFLHIPSIAAPIAVVYNLDGVSDLRLDGPTLARIFQREVVRWDDPAIASLNPDVELPDLGITVARRSDGAGTTKNFTRYLQAAAEGVWRLGVDDTVEWPVDTEGGQQNTGVAQIVKDAPGGIGYLDYGNARELGLPMVAMRNREGNFVAPSVEASTAALAGAELDDDLTYDPLDGPGADAYPITAPTYLLVRTRYGDAGTRDAVVSYVRWLITDGADAYAASLGYAPVPGSFRTAAFAALDRVEAG